MTCLNGVIGGQIVNLTVSSNILKVQTYVDLLALSGVDGDIVEVLDNHKLYVYTGAVWVDVGTDGASATVNVGTTATLAPGSSATVANSGTTAAAIFDFGIPRGAIGPAGTQMIYGVVNPTIEGNDGDTYINTATNYLFGPKAGGVWPAGVSLVGPEGPAPGILDGGTASSTYGGTTILTGGNA